MITHSNTHHTQMTVERSYDNTQSSHTDDSGGVL